MRFLTTVCGSAVALLAALPPQEAAAFNPQYIWYGRGVITALTSACSATKLKVGMEFNSNYRPKVQASEPPAGITMMFMQSGNVFKQADTNGHLAGNGSYIAFQIRSGVDISPRLTGTYANTVKNFFNGQPGFNEGTIPLVIDPGRINDFGGTTGCTVTFRAAYVRMP